MRSRKTGLVRNKGGEFGAMDMDAYEIHAHIAYRIYSTVLLARPRHPPATANGCFSQFRSVPSAVIYDAYENAYPHIFDGHLPAVASFVGSLFSLSPLPHLSDVLSTTEEERPRPGCCTSPRRRGSRRRALRPCPMARAGQWPACGWPPRRGLAPVRSYCRTP